MGYFFNQSWLTKSIFLCVCALSSLEAAPYYRAPPASRATSVQESIGELRHELDNHEIELRQLEERLNTQEMIIDILRDQLKEAQEAEKELFRGKSATAETKVAALENALSKATSDIVSLQAHCGESFKGFSRYQQKVDALEKNMVHMQAALQSLVAAVGGEEEKSAEASLKYQVKNGDSLEKIAKRHQTTVQKIKEANGLKSDRIFVGQRLILVPN